MEDRFAGTLLGTAVGDALGLAAEGMSARAIARRFGRVQRYHLRYGHDPLLALTEAISAGGDTDSIAAILGAWLGTLHGPQGLPQELIQRLHDGPFGPTHLRALAASLSRAQAGQPAEVPGFSASAALARNLALLPVVLLHGLRRVIPF